MKTIKVIIQDVETEKIENLNEEQAKFLVANFLSMGYPKKISETVTYFYPPNKIERIEVEDSVLLTP